MSHRNVNAPEDIAAPLAGLWSASIRNPLFGWEWGGCLNETGALLAGGEGSRGRGGDQEWPRQSSNSAVSHRVHGLLLGSLSGIEKS